jgi:4-coumarate--CoA ligase
MAQRVFVGRYAPFAPIQENLSLPQFMTKYNPDNVSQNKVVHTDTICNKEITYGGLRNEAARCAWGLRAAGLAEGQRLLAIVPNSTDFVLLAHAVWWAGACLSPLNPSSTSQDIVHALNLVKPAVIAVYPGCISAVDEALKQIDWKPVIITVLSRLDNLKLFPGDVSGQTEAEALPPYDLTTYGRTAGDTAAVICFSSGTTGKIKGVQLSHANLITNTLQARCALPSFMNSSAREVFFPPYCHIYGLSVVVIGGMWLGTFTCAIPSFDLELFCAKSAEYRANWAHLVPPVALLMASSDIPLKYNMDSLERIIIAAAPTKKALQQRLKTRFGQSTKILQGYGLSECAPTVMVQHEADEEDVGTVGRVVSGTEVRLVDPTTLIDVELGQEGEVWVRGPQVMMGYVGDVEATKGTFEGEWLRTGDIMRVDEKENFWVTDRLKELIKYKGFQVAPSELEDILIRHPSVSDAAVCSVYDDDQATELPVAYVSFKEELLAKEGFPINTALGEVREWFDGQVAGYKKLRGGVFHLQSLPKTPSGKILRRLLPAKTDSRRTSKL